MVTQTNQTSQTKPAALMALPGAIRRTESRAGDANAAGAAEEGFAARLQNTMQAADESARAEDQMSPQALRRRKKIAALELAGNAPTGPATLPVPQELRPEQTARPGLNRDTATTPDLDGQATGGPRRFGSPPSATSAAASLGDETTELGRNDEFGADTAWAATDADVDAAPALRTGLAPGAPSPADTEGSPSIASPSIAANDGSGRGGAVMTSELDSDGDAVMTGGKQPPANSTGHTDTPSAALQQAASNTRPGNATTVSDATAAITGGQGAEDANPALANVAMANAPRQATANSRAAAASGGAVAAADQARTGRADATSARPGLATPAPTNGAANAAARAAAPTAEQTAGARTEPARDTPASNRRTTEKRNPAADSDLLSARPASSTDPIRTGAAASPLATPITSPAAGADMLASLSDNMSAGPAEPMDSAPAELTELPAIDAQLDPALVSDEFQGQLGERVISAIRQDLNSAEIRVTPQELGPVRIGLTMDGDTAHVTFSAEHGATRQALQDTLPTLRDMLANEGWQLGQAEVRDDRGAGQMADQRQQQADERQGRQARHNDPLAEQAGADSSYRPAGGARGLVDLFA